jgi:TolB protein
MKRIVCLAVAAAGALAVLIAQDFKGTISGGQKPSMAIPVFRGSGNAQNFMGIFNQTLRTDIDGSGFVNLVPVTQMPLFVPQQPSDFVTPPPIVDNPRPKRGEMARPTSGGGRWMQDWGGPPVNATYLAFGYTGDQNNVLVLHAWLYDLRSGVGNPQVIGKSYVGTVDDGGARKVAHQFAADIIAALGGKPLFGTHIYFVHQQSKRSPVKEIWRMDPDGTNQQQLTRFNSTSIQPSVSPDGTKVAFTSYYKGTPGIFVFSVDPVRDLRFYNQVASMNETPSFTPDGKQIVYASSAGRCCRIFISNLDGTGFKAITSSSFIDSEPKVSPKSQQIAFSSGRSGAEQVWLMNIDGGDIQRLTDGTGEASNPSWNPDGQHIAFSWTRGFAAGKFNVFWMDIATHSYVQLTHDEGKNENPTWAPDGIHLTFMSNRTGSEQIFTMLANGTQVQQITRQGENYSPVWGM